MTDRLTASNEFLTRAGWQSAQRTTVAGDASNRRYDRLENSSGKTVILMDAPSDKGEDVRPFVRIAIHLRQLGLSAPEILAKDVENGFLLIEDLGDDLFARILQRDTSLERPLYTAAVDVLTHLHRATCPALKPYDADVMTDMAALAYVWYARNVSDEKAAVFRAMFHTLVAPLDDTPQVLIQRDYHAENLLWLPNRDGVARVGLLDFQDAMSGHAAYDLVSILQDARRDVSAEIEAEMKAHYVATNGLDADEFNRAYAILGLQRNLRILGVFARLCMRDGKAHYVDLIPRVWGHIQTNLAHPALSEIAAIVNADLPAPTPEIMEHLKSQCATIPHQ
jgi:aminoglycoside/choline kinase family phosphotransferase